MATVEQLPEALRSKSAGATIIKEVRVDFREDSGDRLALFVVLVLTDPPDQGTWPVDDLWELRRVVRETIAEQAPDLDMPWYVVFEPEHPDLLDEDDD